MKTIRKFLSVINILDYIFILIYTTAILIMVTTGHADAAAWVFAAGYTYMVPQFQKYKNSINEKSY